MDKATTEACEYAALISDICKMSVAPGFAMYELEQRVFARLGYETQYHRGEFQIREKGSGTWTRQPQILQDFGTAIHYTIGHRRAALEHPLENNWYIREMCETTETTSMDFRSSRIAAWAIRLHKLNSPFADATAISPAAALVAAWLRAHP